MSAAPPVRLPVENENGITVRQLREFLEGWPDADSIEGEPEVWIDTGDRRTNVCVGLWPLNRTDVLLVPRAAPAPAPASGPVLEVQVRVPLLPGTPAVRAGRLAEALAAALIESLSAVSDPSRRPEVEARVIGGVQ